ncbi:unnamed protein product [Trichobilharzia regenti]|nr:unnamed protein product [Trichobilharzia regenti]
MVTYDERAINYGVLRFQPVAQQCTLYHFLALYIPGRISSESDDSSDETSSSLSELTSTESDSSDSSDVYDRQSSNNSEYGWLPGREQEFESIYTFVSNKLSLNSGGCMYISGIPGTGKTASVQAVLSTMHKLVADKTLGYQIPAFQVIYVNGMRVNDPKQIYVQIYEVSCFN